MDTLLVITNCPDEETANRIALALVEEQLAACVNLLPRVQSLYRWQGAVESAGALGGNMVDVGLLQGLMYVAAVMPIGVVGLLSAIHQGKVAAAAMMMVGQRPDMSGKGITMTVMVETYAVLALLASFLMVNAIKL